MKKINIILASFVIIATVSYGSPFQSTPTQQKTKTTTKKPVKKTDKKAVKKVPARRTVTPKATNTNTNTTNTTK